MFYMSIKNCYDSHAWIDGHWRHATGAECPTFELAHPSPGASCQHDGGRDHYSETHGRCWECHALVPYEHGDGGDAPSRDEITVALHRADAYDATEPNVWFRYADAMLSLFGLSG